jgi:diaminopimelate decarboxylase
MHESLQRVLAHHDIRNGCLYMGGRSVTDLAAEVGTPCYLYDSRLLEVKRQRIRSALPPNLKITYAVKANPNIEVIRKVGPMYDGIDIASEGELMRALEAGIDPSHMSFAGPGKRVPELKLALEHGIGSISIEGERELDHIIELAQTLGRTARIMIRVNPAFELARSGLKMGGGPKQFGIDSERVPAVIERLRGVKGVEYRGIHVFSGTQNLSAESLLEAFGKILAYAADLAAETKTSIPVLNLGGGFGIPYFKGDAELDLQAVGQGLSLLLDQYSAKLPGTIFKTELGRYLVGEAGIYLTSVVYRKLSRGSVFLMLDGGMHHHLPASGNLSLSPVRRQMQVCVANRLQGTGEGDAEKVNLAGPLCTPLDSFGFDVELPKADENDLIAVPNSGAYGYSISPLGFLSHPLPKEILL